MYQLEWTKHPVQCYVESIFLNRCEAWIFRKWWLEMVWREHGLQEDEIQTKALDAMTSDYFSVYDKNKDGYLQEEEYRERPLPPMRRGPRKEKSKPGKKHSDEL
ncbi:hypothetical protein LSH36_430g04080 [Paralvinella palmiformis]|uniref:EF-hand domain-containing protein n=1 Tax=Paralvinella palmiformis TaxID=53620 RepID=A0AAD9JCT9_9ANNE|nr:hypothetical protein LSH36_430g04080 [Paralvinella palmiformis]